MNNTNNQLDIHPEIQNRLYQYISNGILNTIFYGGPGVGKHTLILNMFRSLNPNLKEKEKVQFWEETGVRIYSTSNYIRFDAKECVRKKANLPKIIEEITTVCASDFKSNAAPANVKNATYTVGVTISKDALNILRFFVA